MVRIPFRLQSNIYKIKFKVNKLIFADPKPFRPSPQIDGFEPRHFQIGRQTNFFGQNSASQSVGQQIFVHHFAKNSTTAVVVDQNSPTSFNFFGQSQNFFEQNSPSPKANNFFEQNGHVSRPEVQTAIVEKSPPQFFGQKPSPVFDLFHQATLDQIHRQPVGQSTRGSRHILFDNSTFHDEEEVDTPSDRIFRGWELDPHEFPWMVKLMVRLFSNESNVVDLP